MRADVGIRPYGVLQEVRPDLPLRRCAPPPSQRVAVGGGTLQGVRSSAEKGGKDAPHTLINQYFYEKTANFVKRPLASAGELCYTVHSIPPDRKTAFRPRIRGRFFAGKEGHGSVSGRCTTRAFRDGRFSAIPVLSAAAAGMIAGAAG